MGSRVDVGPAVPCGIACVQVRATPAIANGGPELLEHLLARLAGVVRRDDRVCPASCSRLMVELRSDATRVAPFELGQRLAQAVGQHLVVDGQPAELTVAVGLATPYAEVDGVDLTRIAIAAQLGSRDRLEHRHDPPGADPVTAAVTTDVDPASPNHAIGLYQSEPDDANEPRGSQALGQEISSSRVAPPRRRRNAWILSTGSLSRGSAQLSGRAQGEDGDVSAHRANAVVIDPTPSTPGSPGLSAVAAASVAEGIGLRSVAVARGSGGQLPLEIEGAPVDLAILVLDGSRAAQFSSRSPGTWRIPTQVTRYYVSAGVAVVAVSAGAGAATLAACAVDGAVPLVDLNQLPDLLQRMSIADPTSRPGRGPRRLVWTEGCPLPSHFQALVDLTASERRVLFYMMGGWAAQDIADDLVVSLTTVRSHIRSILRKLNVRSQLAAVAIANSREARIDGLDPTRFARPDADGALGDQTHAITPTLHAHPG
jgi:DNA-binding CsgD family transcriptional regulator